MAVWVVAQSPQRYTAAMHFTYEERLELCCDYLNKSGINDMEIYDEDTFVIKAGFILDIISLMVGELPETLLFELIHKFGLQPEQNGIQWLLLKDLVRIYQEIAGLKINPKSTPTIMSDPYHMKWRPELWENEKFVAHLERIAADSIFVWEVLINLDQN